jgi:hypothetical protein
MDIRIKVCNALILPASITHNLPIVFNLFRKEETVGMESFEKDYD